MYFSITVNSREPDTDNLVLLTNLHCKENTVIMIDTDKNSNSHELKSLSEETRQSLHILCKKKKDVLIKVRILNAAPQIEQGKWYEKSFRLMAHSLTFSSYREYCPDYCTCYRTRCLQRRICTEFFQKRKKPSLFLFKGKNSSSGFCSH